MGWFDKAMSKIGLGVKAIEKASDKVEDIVEQVEEVKEVVDTVTETTEELLLLRTNELSVATALVERLRGEVLERVAEIDCKIDKALSPKYRPAGKDEFDAAVKGATKMPATKEPKGSEAVLINYYNKGLLEGVEIRWPQKRFYYLTNYEMPNLETIKNELLDTIRV